MSFGLYLHIPYCASKCRYCDFYSKGGSGGVPEEYITALLREMARHSAVGASTVYFGGGTPSLLNSSQVARLLQAAAPARGAEITLEANPDSLTQEKLEGYLEAGVNRLSIGVQSASDAQLRLLGRTHTASEAAQSFAMAKAAGFQNISGDIMLALPGEGESAFLQTLALIEQGGASHISCYLLKIEENTYFGRHRPAGLPDDDEAAALYLFAAAELEKHGYRQYEISNFARPAFESRHNLLYWNCENYLGLGPAAYSCMDGRRFHYPADLPAFVARIAPVVQDGVLDAEDYIMLQLRLAKGLNLALCREMWGSALSEKALKKIPLLQKAGYCHFENDLLRLTPAGMVVQNAILAELL